MGHHPSGTRESLQEQAKYKECAYALLDRPTLVRLRLTEYGAPGPGEDSITSAAKSCAASGKQRLSAILFNSLEEILFDLLEALCCDFPAPFII
jgi:hypothetical protein